MTMVLQSPFYSSTEILSVILIINSRLNVALAHRMQYHAGKFQTNSSYYCIPVAEYVQDWTVLVWAICKVGQASKLSPRQESRAQPMWGGGLGPKFKYNFLNK